MARTAPVPRVLELDRSQPEFTTPFGRYFGLRVSPGRIETGRQQFKDRRALLQRVYQESGVPGHYLVAFWGLETNFGSYLGKMPLLGSLATLACDPRRAEFFASQWLDAVRLLERGDLTFDRLESSWAGALGHVQFMPSVYLHYAEDGDGDGRVDLFGSVDDAMVSAGAFLQGLGWVRGERWGREVSLPEGFDYGAAGRQKRRSLAAWGELGVRQSDGAPLPVADLDAALLVPSGHQGPAFLVYRNFDVIMDGTEASSMPSAWGSSPTPSPGAPGYPERPPTTSCACPWTRSRRCSSRLSRVATSRAPSMGFLALRPALPSPGPRRPLGSSPTATPTPVLWPPWALIFPPSRKDTLPCKSPQKRF